MFCSHENIQSLPTVVASGSARSRHNPAAVADTLVVVNMLQSLSSNRIEGYQVQTRFDNRNQLLFKYNAATIRN